MTISHHTTAEHGICPNCGSEEHVFRPPAEAPDVYACEGCGARWNGRRETVVPDKGSMGA